MRVLAALSGGVDSAVAAARAKDAGHDVTAVHLALSPSSRDDGRGCCTPEDARDARRVADVLDLPFYVWDLAARFQADVVDDFLAEYAAGRTPNPCLRCNERIKFAAVLDKARGLGFDAVCTGHYARLVGGRLHRAADRDKDQSYVLGTLTREQLEHSLFPVGDSTKQEIRAEAAERGLMVAAKKDSYDVCFVPGDTGAWLRERLGAAPGPLVEDGRVVGAHEGAHAFTIGQRKGLGINSPDGRPRYVLSISPATSTVEVGTADRLDVTSLDGIRPVWAGGSYEGPCLAQVRAHGAAVPATVTAAFRVTFDEPVRGVAPGQAVVLYDGDRVLGAATIARTGGRSGRTPSRPA